MYWRKCIDRLDLHYELIRYQYVNSKAMIKFESLVDQGQCLLLLESYVPELQFMA